MKQGVVSIVAVIFCCAVLGGVGLFGYSRYKASQAKEAEFQAQLQNQSAARQELGARMPAELGSRGRAQSSP